MTHVTRRHFLTAAGALAASPALIGTAFAQGTKGMSLRATTRTLDINGRAATVYGLENAAGGQGLILDPGQRFAVDLTNDLDVETIIHWHGQIPPNAQDGVPGMPMPLLTPGERRSYDFAPLPGTHWMHSHVPVQEMQLLAAPLIVRSSADLAADRQEVVMLLHDFSFKPAEDMLAEITGGAGHDMAGMDHGAPAPEGAVADMGHSAMGGMAGMAMDLNDYNFDAYLANDRTLNDPDVIRVEASGRVRLRIINAAAATVFWIDTGAVQGRMVAVDGHDVLPVTGTPVWHRDGAATGYRTRPSRWVRQLSHPRPARRRARADRDHAGHRGRRAAAYRRSGRNRSPGLRHRAGSGTVVARGQSAGCARGVENPHDDAGRIDAALSLDHRWQDLGRSCSCQRDQR